jgi:ketosteroid isomerase-like protein
MLERAWVDAVNRGDQAVVSRILTDDFEGIDQAGHHFDKPKAVQEPLLGAFLTDAYAALEQVEARLYGDTAVVTSRVKMRNSQARGAMTHVYIRRGGRWQCIASHASWASGAVCPAVGPIAERAPSSTRETRSRLRPTDEMTSNCRSCHSADHRKETRNDHSPEDYYAAINAKTESRGTLAVTIGPAGIQIAGKEIEPEPKALEERFRAARDAEGQAKVALSVFHETPFWTIKMVTDAAQRVGLRDISLEPLVDHPDRTAQPIKSGPAIGGAARP